MPRRGGSSGRGLYSLPRSEPLPQAANTCRGRALCLTCQGLSFRCKNKYLWKYTFMISCPRAPRSRGLGSRAPARPALLDPGSGWGLGSRSLRLPGPVRHSRQATKFSIKAHIIMLINLGTQQTYKYSRIYCMYRLMSTPRIESVLGGPHRLLGLRGCLCPFHRGGPRRLLHGAVSHWGPPAHRRAGPPA